MAPPLEAKLNPNLALCVRLLTLLLLPASFVGTVAAACVDKGTVELDITATSVTPLDAKIHRLQLAGMVQEALDRSRAYGATKFLAEAAASDVDEASAAAKPQLFLTGTIGPGSSSTNGISSGSGLQTRATLNLTSPLFDHGRVHHLTAWRSHLAEAARRGQINAQEQIALQTVSLVLERGRYSMQAQVYRQYAQKMSCLVGALEQITKADKGRASELVQARKTLQQVELSYTQSLATLRQVETRLRRFVGDELPASEDISSVLLALPTVTDAVTDAEQANEVALLDAQAKAMESSSNALVAGQKPQFNWLVTGSRANGPQRSGDWGLGVSFTIPLIDPAADPAARASVKRAEAARLQFEEALHSRRYRVLEVHDQATTAFDRAQQVVRVLHDSDLVRNATLQQWQQLGRRSLFDVMSAEGEHYSLRAAYVNALYDGQQSVALLWSLGRGVTSSLE
ncbi:MAG: TolC family protein [Burkholderiaceae bacterium]|nr:TolC family protein [Burkholderiaceae bacterium]